MEDKLLLFFPEWLSEIDESIDGKIHAIVKENTINEELAKNLVEEKVKGGFFAKKDIDFSKISFSVENSFAISVNQKRHFETRKVERRTVPYDSDKFSKVGFEEELEDLWAQYLIDKFTKKELQWVRGGSAEISPCGTCDSRGLIRCPKCKGKGEYREKCYKCNGNGEIQNRCPSCNGSGKVNEGQITVGGGKRIGAGVGYSSREVQCIRCNAHGYLSERCSKCSGQGQLLVTCNQCNGSGEITCTTCLGYQQLYTCDMITANCKPSEQDFIVSNFGKVKSTWFNSDKTIQSEYYEIAGELDLGEYVKPASKEGRVLLEGYNLKIIPVSRVILNDGNKENSIFIVGKDKNIIGATSSYLDYKKILLLGLPIVIALTILIVFLFNKQIKEEEKIINQSTLLNNSLEKYGSNSKNDSNNLNTEFKPLPMLDKLDISRVKKLFNDWILATINKESLEPFYAPQVDYYTWHITNKNNVLKDKANFYSRWEKIEISVIDLKIKKKTGEYYCNYVKQYKASNDQTGQISAGKIKSELVFNNNLLIVKEKDYTIK